MVGALVGTWWGSMWWHAGWWCRPGCRGGYSARVEPAVPIMGVMSRVVILVAAGSTQCACVVSEASVLYRACVLMVGVVPAYATGEARK